MVKIVNGLLFPSAALSGLIYAVCSSEVTFFERIIEKSLLKRLWGLEQVIRARKIGSYTTDCTFNPAGFTESAERYLNDIFK